MESVLRESDDGVAVFVAPTKALVNQGNSYHRLCMAHFKIYPKVVNRSITSIKSFFCKAKFFLIVKEYC